MTKMFTVFTLVMALLIVNFATNAYAQIPSCAVRVHWTSMGSFDQAGNWTWNDAWRYGPTVPPAVAHGGICNEWGPANPCNDEQYWTPILNTGPAIKEARLMYRQFSNPTENNVELSLNIQVSKTVSYPIVWEIGPHCGNPSCGAVAEPGCPWSWNASFQPPDGAQNWPPIGPCQCAHDYLDYAQKREVREGDPPAQCGYGENGVLYDLTWNPFAPGIETDPNINPNCKPWRKVNFETVPFEGPPINLDKNQIISVEWIRPDGTSNGLMTFKNCMDVPAHYLFFDYDMNWKVNDWTFRQDLYYGPEVRLRSITPITKGVNKFIVTYNAGDGNKTIEVNILVSDNGYMPTVAASRIETNRINAANTSGKTVKYIEGVTTINNITYRYLNNGDLVIQWPEPDGVLLGGMQLRAFLGNVSIPGNGCYANEEFLFYNSPAQMGTLVVAAQDLAGLRQKILARDPNATNYIFFIMYRINESGPTLNANYSNRGYSSPIYIPMN